MKKVLLFTFIVFGIGSLFTGCEKSDYQHPMHRTNENLK